MLTIRLLGGASIHDPGEIGSGRAIQRNRMALLALIALSRTRSMTRERAMAFLWPDNTTERARQSLRECLYRLRETIGDGTILTAGDEIRLDPARIDCDVWSFEAAVAQGEWRRADALYTGPLLDGVFLAGGAEFEHWIEGERQRLGGLYAQVVEGRANEHTVQGDHPGAVEHWRRRAALEPHNARVALRLMEALDAAGDRVGALRLAEVHAALLESELGANPDPAVAAFAERLRLDPPRRLPPPIATGSPPREGRAETAPLPSRRSSGFFNRRPVRQWIAVGGAIALVSAAVRISTAGDALDANRIAILPFRTSGADPSLALLHDGLVELLSVELTGDVGPAAVDAGEVLRAWRRIGGDNEPTTREVALRAARQVGAGQVAFGAVAGSAGAFSVTLSVVDVPTGATRIDRVRVSGAIDSLPRLVAGLSARVRARSAGSWTLSAADPERTSTDALRAYLEGMVAYRRANWALAGAALRNAAELDSTFAAAAYRLAIIYAILVPRTPFGERPTPDARRIGLFRRLWHHRDRLSSDQRMLLEAVADSHYVLWRMQALPRLERAAELMPASVEAWDMLGDNYFHAGALVGVNNWAERAKHAFLRAREIDSALAVNAQRHLADLAFMKRDADAHARFATAAAGPRGPAYLAYQSAVIRGNLSSIRDARTRYARAWGRNEEEGLGWAFRGLTVPHTELDSLIREFEARAPTQELRDSVVEWKRQATYLQGRPGAASRVLGGVQQDSVAEYGAALERAEDDSLAAERLGRAVESRIHPYRCEVALSRLRRRDTTGAAAILAAQPSLDDRRRASDVMSDVGRGLDGQAKLCGQVLRAVLASTVSSNPRSTLALLLRADSMMKITTVNYGTYWNYDLALGFARRGEYAAAAAAVRRRFVDASNPPRRLVLSLRQEGRWAAQAGDIAGAIEAYEHYLLWRGDPEPALVPQRDSVRAELAAISRARR